MVLVKVAYYAISTARLFMLRITLVLENFATFSQSVLFKREKKKVQIMYCVFW